MGADSFLFCIATPLTCATDRSPDVSPFGSLEAITARLREGASAERAWAGGDDPARRGVTLDHEHDGRRIGLSLQGDPVQSISIGGAPWDLLPFVERLAELGPFAIFDPVSCVFVDPSAHAAREPRAIASWLERVPSFPATAWSLRARDALGAGRVTRGDAGSVLAVGHGRVAAIDARSGDVRWSLECGRGATYATCAGGVVVVVSDHPRVLGVDAASGATRWSAPIRGRVTCPPTSVGDRAVAIVSEAGEVVVLDVETGASLLRAEVGAAIRVAPVVVEGALVIATPSGTVRAIELATVSGTVRAMDIASGATRAEVGTGELVHALLAEGGNVWARTRSAILALDPRTLAVIGRFDLGFEDASVSLAYARGSIWAALAREPRAFLELDRGLAGAQVWEASHCGELAGPLELVSDRIVIAETEPGAGIDVTTLAPRDPDSMRATRLPPGVALTLAVVSETIVVSTWQWLAGLDGEPNAGPS